MDKTEIIKQHFEDEAKEYDDIILRLIPYYKEMLDALVLSIPFDRQASINVMDLGCGTGTVAKSVKDVFPNAKIHCLDLSENMLRIAEAKLASPNDTKFTAGDFYSFDFGDKYDVIVSSLALHHLVTDEDKKMFYARIFNALSAGGVFYNADLAAGSSDYLQKVYMQKWKEYILRSVSQDEVENNWMAKHRQEDSPSVLSKQLEWLKEIGFVYIDVLWKYYYYAVFGGQKPE